MLTRWNPYVILSVWCMCNFDTAVKSCFGKSLDNNYEDTINRSKMESTGLKVTPKVHAVFFHVIDFCNQQHTGLGSYSA